MSSAIRNSIIQEVKGAKYFSIIADEVTDASNHAQVTTEPNPDPLRYPQTRPCPSSHLRRFKPEWLKHHPWMHYSKFSDGVYCRACVVFAPYQAGGQNLGKFVLEPFRYWTNTADKATDHAKSEYHRNAMSMMTEFLARYESPSQAVNVLLDSQLRQNVDTNQKVIEALLRIIILCGSLSRSGQASLRRGVVTNEGLPTTSRGR